MLNPFRGKGGNQDRNNGTGGRGQIQKIFQQNRQGGTKREIPAQLEDPKANGDNYMM